MENVKYLCKDTFAVIGKAGQGAADNSQTWILPLWEDANSNFSEIADIIRKSGNGAPFGVWGAMNDEDAGGRSVNTWQAAKQILMCSLRWVGQNG